MKQKGGEKSTTSDCIPMKCHCCSQNPEWKSRRDKVRLTVDQSRESGKDKNHRVPHPGSEQPEKKEKGKEDGDASRDSGSCWKISAPNPVGIRWKQREHVLTGEEGGGEGKGGGDGSRELCLPLREVGLKWKGKKNVNDVSKRFVGMGGVNREVFIG